MNDATLMQIAFLVARESKCVSHQVGAVISKNGRIISTGINGTHSGSKNCCDHALDKGWLCDDIKTPKEIKIGFEKFNPPYGSTHCFEALNIYKFVKVIGEIVYHWDHLQKTWYRTSTPFSILKTLKTIVWVNPNFGENKHLKTLNPFYREEHSKWSSENEIHAEKNALLFCNKHGLSVDGATMYVTLSPCYQCAKELPMSGITRVVYCDLYDKNSSDWKDILTKSGIEVCRIDKSLLTEIKW